MTLKPLLESDQGIHLTIYLDNRGDLIDLKNQLQESITKASEWLDPVLNTEEREKFLEPLSSLLEDARIFKELKGNIAIFRNQEYFRLLNIPIRVKAACYVATSFHVKPILKWMQTDKEFLVLALEKNAASLYLGSQSTFKLVDSMLFPDTLNEESSYTDRLNLSDFNARLAKEKETIAWLNLWLSQLTRNTKPKLFLSGEKSLVAKMSRRLRYTNAIKTPVIHIFSEHSVSVICSSIRKIMKAEAKDHLERYLFDFRVAEESRKVRKDLFEISKAAVQGRVRKLLVTDELNIFGKIDPKTGSIEIHPFDLDHEDDDLLDDLAQIVLSHGGEVIVASRDEIPKGGPILAILDGPRPDAEKTLSTQNKGQVL